MPPTLPPPPPPLPAFVAAAAGGLQRGRALSFDTLEHFCAELGKPFPSPPLAFPGEDEGVKAMLGDEAAQKESRAGAVRADGHGAGRGGMAPSAGGLCPVPSWREKVV